LGGEGAHEETGKGVGKEGKTVGKERKKAGEEEEGKVLLEAAVALPSKTNVRTFTICASLPSPWTSRFKKPSTIASLVAPLRRHINPT
jgi:hypothetical protein